MHEHACIDDKTNITTPKNHAVAHPFLSIGTTQKTEAVWKETATYAKSKQWEPWLLLKSESQRGKGRNKATCKFREKQQSRCDNYWYVYLTMWTHTIHSLKKKKNTESQKNKWTNGDWIENLTFFFSSTRTVWIIFLV